MFKISFGQLRNPSAHHVLNKMVSSTGYESSQAAYRVAKLVKLFSDEARTCDQVFVGLLKREGIEIKPDGTYEVSDDKIDQWKVVHEDFCKTQTDLPTTKLAPSDLPSGLAPSEILAIEEMIDQ